MSTNTAKLTHHQAMKAAAAFEALFSAESYERWEYAGSVRRGRAQVGDIEHVLIARVGEVRDGSSLFAEAIQRNLVWAQLEAMEGAGKVAKHVYPGGSVRWGEKYRGVDVDGRMHEIFLADKENWGAILAIRTGPAEFSRMLVTALQREGYMQAGGYVRNKRDWLCRCGWRGADPDHASVEELGERCQGNKTLYRQRNGEGPAAICPTCRQPDLNPMIVPVPDEETYFRLAGVGWRKPEARG